MKITTRQLRQIIREEHTRMSTGGLPTSIEEAARAFARAYRRARRMIQQLHDHEPDEPWDSIEELKMDNEPIASWAADLETRLMAAPDRAVGIDLGDPRVVEDVFREYGIV